MKKLLLHKIKFFKIISTNDIALLAVSVLFALRWFPNNHRNLFFFIFSGLSILAALIFIVKKNIRKSYWKLDTKYILIFVFFIFSILSTIFSSVLYFPDNKNFILYLAYFLIFMAFSLTNAVERKILFGMFNLLVVLVIIQYILILLINKDYYTIYGLTLNKSTLANVLAIYFFIFLHNSKKINIFNVVYATILILVILSTGSRTAIIAVLLSLIVIFSFKFDRKQLFSSVSILGIVLGGIVYGLYLWRPDSVKGRLLLWKAFLSSSESIKDLFFGRGLGYSEFKTQMFLKSYLQNSNTPEQLLAGSTFSPMNEYVQIFIDSGIIGAFLFIVILVFTSYYFIIRKKLFLLAANISFMSICFFSYPLYSPFIWILLLFFWTFNNEMKYKVFGYKNLYFRTIAVFIICFLLFTVFKISVHSFYLIKWNNVQSKVDYLYDEPGFQKTYTILNKQLSNTPDFLSDYAQKLQALSRYDQSKKMLEKAVRIEPTAERLMLLGYDCEMLDFYDKAEYYYKNAIQTQPKLFRPRYLLLKLYIKLDKRTLAKDVATNILLFPVKVPSQEVKDIKMAAKNYLSGI